MERASVEIWNWIEGLSTDKQKHLLQWQLQAREQIHSFKDVRLGDHLVRKDSFLGLVPYEHHFICVGFNGEGKPMIVHYYNTPWKATAQLIPSISGCGSPIEQLAAVQEMCIIYLFIYYFPTIKITQALHYTKMWRGDLRKPQGLYEEAPSLQ